MSPLLDLTDGLGHESASTDNTPAEFHKGYWILRNLGGILDALHEMTEPDDLIPPCAYCAKRKTHSQEILSLFLSPAPPNPRLYLRGSCACMRARAHTRALICYKIQVVGLLNPELNANLLESCRPKERAKKIECSRNCSDLQSWEPNRYTLVEKGTAECYENW